MKYSLILFFFTLNSNADFPPVKFIDSDIVVKHGEESYVSTHFAQYSISRNYTLTHQDVQARVLKTNDSLTVYQGSHTFKMNYHVRAVNQLDDVIITKANGHLRPDSFHVSFDTADIIFYKKRYQFDHFQAFCDGDLQFRNQIPIDIFFLSCIKSSSVKFRRFSFDTSNFLNALFSNFIHSTKYAQNVNYNNNIPFNEVQDFSYVMNQGSFAINLKLKKLVLMPLRLIGQIEYQKNSRTNLREVMIRINTVRFLNISVKKMFFKILSMMDLPKELKVEYPYLYWQVE